MKIFLCGQRSFGKEVCRALLDAEIGRASCRERV